MSVPGGVARAVEAAWSRTTGRQQHLLGDAPLGGGCISPAARLESAAGDVAFLKWGTQGTPPGLFTAEAESLDIMRETATVRVPEVLAASDEGPGWLLLEWLEPGRTSLRGWEQLGRGLAALHAARAPGGRRCGWAHDNYIGSLPQENGWLEDWPAFWRERRLLPQLRRAYAGGHFRAEDRRRFEHLLERLPELLAGWEADGAGLVHGDLWGGNVHARADGGAALIDPAAYYGHGEVDLAMSRLFGGFDAAFYEAYRDARPVRAGDERLRLAVYQLYYLLVHVNLFGGGYAGQTLGVLARTGV